MAQKAERPTTKVLNAQHAKAMGMIDEGSRDALAYSRALQDFTDGARQYHGEPEMLNRIFEKLGIQMERVEDAAKRLGVSFSEGIAIMVASDRTRMIRCILDDLDFLAHVMKATGFHPEGVREARLELVLYAAQPSNDLSLRPRWAPSLVTSDCHVFRWEVVIKNQPLLRAEMYHPTPK